MTQDKAKQIERRIIRQVALKRLVILTVIRQEIAKKLQAAK